MFDWEVVMKEKNDKNRNILWCHIMIEIHGNIKTGVILKKQESVMLRVKKQ